MRDKERILLWLVNRLYANCLYARENLTKWRDIQPGIFSNDNPLQVGDLVTTQTTFKVNDFIVGYVEELQKDCEAAENQWLEIQALKDELDTAN